MQNAVIPDSPVTNMRVSVLLCWAFVFLCCVDDGDAEDRRVDDDKSGQRTNPVLAKESVTKRGDPFWTSALIRGKRSEESEETFPTRHAKHRKRHRSKNRSRNAVASRSSNLAGTQDQTSKDDRESTNVVPESRDLYNETKDEDYYVIAFDKGRINGNVTIVDDSFKSELTEAYDDRDLTDETEEEDKDAPAWMKKPIKDEANDYAEELRPSIIYTAADDQVTFHESLRDLLGKLFQSLRNATDGQYIFKELNFVNRTNEDPCQKWLNSREKLEKVFLGGLSSLPACPCQYPSNIFYDDKIWDEGQRKHHRWRDVSGQSQRLDVYKPGAAYCVRSLLMQGTGSAAAQHCCYDRRRKLLTRGSGAGTPNFVSPEISPILHERIDVLPWRLCKGDFSRYNKARPPNNNNNCEANPDDEEYQRQIDSTKYY